MTPPEKLRILKQNNPFITSSAGDPWKSQISDVPSINHDVFQGITDILDQLSDNPSISTSGLVLGEVGSGKTHLICRLLSASAKPNSAFSFSYVQPIEDPCQTFRYLLKEILHSLCHPIHPQTKICPLDRLIGKMIIETLKQESLISNNTLKSLEKNPLSIFYDVSLSLNLNDIIRKSIQQFRLNCSKTVLKVFFQYPDPQKKSAAFDWLKCDIIDQDDADLLGVYDRQNLSNAAIEQEARDLIVYLGNLLAIFNESLIVCFDRLENLTHDDQIHSLGRMIEFLVDTPKSMLAVIFSRGQQWEEKFRHKFNQQIVTRLETNEFKLKGCSQNQFSEIILSRLQYVFNDKNLKELYPFEAFINDLGDQIILPREIISQANKYLKTILKEKIAPSHESIETVFHLYVKNILSDTNHYPPDRSRLRRALSCILMSIFKVSTHESNYEKDKYVDIKCKISNKNNDSVNCLFLIDLEKHHRSVDAALNRAIDLQSRDSQFSIYYIREKRCPVPEKWKTTHSKFKSLKNYGIQVLFLEIEDIARWYALALLYYDIQEGNISIASEGKKIITPGLPELYEYIKSIDFFKNAIKLNKQEKPIDNSSVSTNLREIIKNFLQNQPTPIISISKLAENLKQKGIVLTLSHVENTLKQFNEFQLFEAGDGPMVMLKNQD